MIHIKRSTNTHLHYKMCAKVVVCVPAYLQTHIQEETFHFIRERRQSLSPWVQDSFNQCETLALLCDDSIFKNGSILGA